VFKFFGVTSTEFRILQV